MQKHAKTAQISMFSIQHSYNIQTLCLQLHTTCRTVSYAISKLLAVKSLHSWSAYKTDTNWVLRFSQG